MRIASLKINPNYCFSVEASREVKGWYSGVLACIAMASTCEYDSGG